MTELIKKKLRSISKNLASTSRTNGPNLTTPELNETIKSNNSNSDFGQKTINILLNISPPKLYQEALLEPNTNISSNGALSVFSGAKTGRCPKDKRVVLDESTKDIWWDEDSPNIKIDKKHFLINRETAICYLNNQQKLYVFDGYAGWDIKNRIKIRIICTRAYHCLFMHNMLIRPTDAELYSFGEPDYVIYNSGEFPCNRFTGYMTSSTSIDFDFSRKEIVILGTQYAGEMKKGVFSIIHYIMPKKNILSLHSSATSSLDKKNVTFFFGLSGTGKTTLSADPNRLLIGDDEHCWSDNGIFNIEGGCYAKCINLNKDAEPLVYNSIRFGSLLENVCLDTITHEVDFTDSSITYNTRVSYPLEFIENSIIPALGNHPNNIIFLTCDAFGVLPPLSKLSLDQAVYYFISGYTAKIPGTEQTVKIPEATFSACFGEAFLVRHPLVYANLLKNKIKKYNCKVWLVNTGWQGGSYGVGSRYPIDLTRNIVSLINDNKLENIDYENFEPFNIQIPKNINNIDSNIFNPKNSWNNFNDFDQASLSLSKMFIKNFEKYKNHNEYINLVKFGPQIKNTFV